MDQVAIVGIRGWVSGTAGANPEGAGGPSNMTGNLVFSTEPKAVVTYVSGAYTIDGNTIVLPTGSVQVILPKDSCYPTILSWGVSLQHSGTDLFANGLATSNNYDIVQYYDSAATGTFIFGFQRISGSSAIGTDNYGSSGTYVGAIPQDRVNPSSPSAQWNLWAYVRNTTMVGPNGRKA